MVLILLSTLLVLGIAFYQAVQGLFSALIMTVLTILCAAVAFLYYEPLAAMLYGRQPAHADAICLIALFVVPLLGLRILFDRFVAGNVLVGAWPDRIAGGALGLVTGMIVTGMLTLMIQMLPTGPRWLMYRPFDDSLRPQQSLSPFYPDEFTLGLMDLLSAGSLGDGKTIHQLHDNLRLEYWCARNQVMQVREVDNEKLTERIGRLDASPDSLTVLACYEPNLGVQAHWWDPNQPIERVVPMDPLIAYRHEKDPTMPEETGKILIVRVAVDQSARDIDNWWRLPATHFRLAVRKDKSADAPLLSHYPLAYLTASQVWMDNSAKVTRVAGANWKAFAAPLDSNTTPKATLPGMLAVERPWKSDGGPPKLVIDWVFRVGREEVPAFLAFRRVARQDMPAAKSGMPDAKEALDRVMARPD